MIQRVGTAQGVDVSSLVFRGVIGFVACLGLSATCVLPASGAPGGRPFTIELTGAAEVNAQGVPNQGDPDGIGTARLEINPGQKQICWTIDVERVDLITAAHIHVAPPTAPGPIVVPLDPYASGCADVDRELALAIVKDPDSYYVNVHNASYPAGALRGQLDGPV
jgi:hypothetical protein